MRWLRDFLGWGDPWRRRRPTPAEVRFDLWLGLFLTALGVIALEALRATTIGTLINESLLESYLWTLLMVVPLAVRRLFPITVMVVCSAVFYISGERVFPVAYSVVVQVALFLAIYTAWAWTPHRRRLFAATGLMIAGMFAWLIQALLTEVPDPGGSWMPASVGSAVTSLGINVAYFFGAVAWGQVSYRGAQQRELVAEQTDQLRRQQEQAARRVFNKVAGTIKRLISFVPSKILLMRESR